MLLMTEKGIRGGKCHSVYKYTKANNKYMKDCVVILFIYGYYVVIWFICLRNVTKASSK